MASVKIALFRGPGIVSRAIRWQTRSDWSHAALVFDDGVVIESREGKGVQKLKRLEPKNGETVQLFSVEVSDWQARKIRSFAEDQVGKKYDWWMVIRFVSRRQETRSTTDAWFCSELVFAAFFVAGIELLRATEPWEVSPGLLARSPLISPDEPQPAAA